MKKCIVAVVLGVVLGIVTSSFAATMEEQIKEAIEKSMNQVEVRSIEKYSVKLFSVGQGIGFCTGTVLSNEAHQSTVITCKHCIQPDEELLVEGNPVTKIITTVGDDLAYLIVQGQIQNKEPAVLGAYNEPIGSTIKMYGQPGMTTIQAVMGEILLYSKDWGYAKIDVLPGCSGAGLFNRDNELIGVIWGGFTEGGTGGGFFSEPVGGTKIGIFEPTDDIREFLANVK